MKNKLMSSLCLSAFCVFSGSAMAKTLVYCSEASPEGFNPSLYTSGTTFEPVHVPSSIHLLVSNVEQLK